METLLHLLPLLAVIAFATYFQTVTGFGLGMIVIGATSGFDLAPVSVVAAVVSLVTLVNSAVALPGRLNLIDWPAARAVLLGVLPASVTGVLLLDYLSSSAAEVLRFMIGAVIAYSGVSLALKPRVQAERSSNRGFFLCGVFAGLSSGLFGMAGPPAIYHLYRQPMEIASIRCMLLLVFAFTASARTLFVATQGGLSAEVWLLTAFAVLLVALASYAGRRFPPPFSATTMRRIAFGTLLAIGLSLMITAVS